MNKHMFSKQKTTSLELKTIIFFGQKTRVAGLACFLNPIESVHGVSACSQFASKRQWIRISLSKPAISSGHVCTSNCLRSVSSLHAEVSETGMMSVWISYKGLHKWRAIQTKIHQEEIFINLEDTLS